MCRPVEQKTKKNASLSVKQMRLKPPLSFVSVIGSSGIILDHQDEVLVVDSQRTLSTLAPGEGESEAVASAAMVCFQVKH